MSTKKKMTVTNPDINVENNTISKLLNALSNEINRLYGYVTIAGDNFGEPAINSGPCGAFAYAFFKLWNQKFTEKVNIVFIMVKNSDECWHTLIRLPDGSLFDGGCGIHSEEKYHDKFTIEDMLTFDIDLLEKRAFGLQRDYPRYCPNFSIKVIENLIDRYLNIINKNIGFQKISPSFPLLETVIASSIGSSSSEKIKQILQDYGCPNRFLMGAFSMQNLVAVIGYELKGRQVIIKHLSVLEAFQKLGIGNTLIQMVISDHDPKRVSVETDDESVAFYKNIGFLCKSFEGNYGIRYRCIQDVSSPNFSIQAKVLAAVKQILPKFTDMHGEIAVASRENIIYHEHFSYADAPILVAKNSQYLIGSVTKQFTAAALLKSLYDKHSALETALGTKNVSEAAVLKAVKNNLQQPVSFFLPEEHPIWHGSMPDWANIVTLHHLLTHTSGIKKKSETVFDATLECTPGQQFSYSNPNYILIGEIIFTITDTPLDDYFKRVLFNPANMEDSFLPLTGSPKDLKRDARFKKLALSFEYQLLPLEVTFVAAEEKISFEELGCAGGIVSTIEDCIKWNNALYHGKIMPMPLVELMLGQYIPSVPFPIYYDLDKVWYGYGIDVYQEGKKICYQHAGGCPGYQARLIYLPATNITIVHLSNSQKDNTGYNDEKNKIIENNQCDDLRAEAIFDKQFPHYKSCIQNRIHIFSFANELRGLFL